MRTRRNTAAALLRHPVKTASLLVCQLSVRCIALLPIWFPVLFPDRPLPAFMSALSFRIFLSSILYYLLVIPCRFLGANTLSEIILNSDRIHAPSYPHLLHAAGIRLFPALIYGLPFYIVLILAYRYLFVLDATRYATDLAKVGRLFLASAEETDQIRCGLILFIILTSFSVLLQAFGWYRGIPFDYQQIMGISVRDARRNAAHIRKKHRKELIINAIADVCLFLLPFFILYFSMVLSNVHFTNDIILPIYSWLYGGMPLRFNISPLFPTICLAMFLLLIPCRKGRNARTSMPYHDV